MGRPRATLTDFDTYPHKYVRPQVLATYIDIPLRTIYYHIQKGALSAVKVGGVLRIPIQIARAYVGESKERTQPTISTHSAQ